MLYLQKFTRTLPQSLLYLPRPLRSVRGFCIVLFHRTSEIKVWLILFDVFHRDFYLEFGVIIQLNSVLLDLMFISWSGYVDNCSRGLIFRWLSTRLHIWTWAFWTNRLSVCHSSGIRDLKGWIFYLLFDVEYEETFGIECFLLEPKYKNRKPF